MTIQLFGYLSFKKLSFLSPLNFGLKGRGILILSSRLGEADLEFGDPNFPGEEKNTSLPII
jgi:hypothetical protein